VRDAVLAGDYGPVREASGDVVGEIGVDGRYYVYLFMLL